jgi:hypothetical protein
MLEAVTKEDPMDRDSIPNNAAAAAAAPVVVVVATLVLVKEVLATIQQALVLALQGMHPSPTQRLDKPGHPELVQIGTQSLKTKIRDAARGFTARTAGQNSPAPSTTSTPTSRPTKPHPTTTTTTTTSPPTPTPGALHMTAHA